MFKENRISTFYCDQTSSASIQKFIKDAAISNQSVDIIIDDGLHSFLAGKTLFENIISYLSPEGMYIIEDESLSDIKLYKNYFLKIDRLFEAKFVYLKSPLIKDEEGNNLFCVTKK